MPVAAAAGSKPAADDVAVVGGTHITQAMFAAALAEERASLKAQGQTVPAAGSTGYAALKTQVVDLLVQQAELGIQAKKMGITVTPAEVQKQLAQIKKTQFGGSEKAYQAGLKQQGFTDAMFRSFLQENVLEKKLYTAVTKGATASKADIAAYYAANLTQYQTPATRAVQEILVGKNKETLANQIYSKILGGAEFRRRSRSKYSQDPGSKDKGGSLHRHQGKRRPRVRRSRLRADRQDRCRPEARQHEPVRLVRDQADRPDQAREDDAGDEGAARDQAAARLDEGPADREPTGQQHREVLLLRREDLLPERVHPVARSVHDAQGAQPDDHVAGCT